jgi:tRNA-dihydrouridine synthase
VIKVSVLGLKNPLILSPLAEITIPPFRRICAEFGAVTVSEMTYVKGLLYNDPKSVRRISRAKTEKKFGIQLLTNCPSDLGKTVELIEKNHWADFIELNLGCPKPKITNADLGAKLLAPKFRKKLNELLEIGASSSKLPFSIKIRLGYEKKSFLEVINLAETANIAFITLHARLATENFLNPANWEFWREAVENSSIPIIANGDIKSYDQATEIIADYGVKGAAIGRSARGNPQIFRKKSKMSPLDVYDRLISYMRNSPYFNLFNLRVQSADFLKQFKFAAGARKQILTLSNTEEIIDYTRDKLTRYHEERNKKHKIQS